MNPTQICFFLFLKGESYADLVQRLEPVILEIERQSEPVLIISHQAVLRVLYAYLTEQDTTACPHLDIPLHTVTQLTPRAFGCEQQHFKLF
jgi:broad specificity phosphatase PhoE